MGVKLLMSTSFHPQTDGVTERANRSVGQLFRAAISPDQKDWVYKIPMMEFAINASISESTGFTPFKLDGVYMPMMIRQLPESNTAPPGIRSFTQQALQNLAAAHDTIIASHVFQRHYANARRRQEPTIKQGDLVYLSTKNLSLPKGRVSKLMPKYVGPYKVLQAYPKTSNYTLELPSELVRRRVHPKFHVSLLRPHQSNDNALFPNRASVDAYDFGAPDDAEWIVDKLDSHQWNGKNLEFQVHWNAGETTWEPLESCKELAALDRYLTLMGVKHWRQLPRKAAARR